MIHEKKEVGCLTKIKKSYNKFRGKDQKIADFILNNSNDCIYLTISQIAEAVDVSESTIFRFCQKLGYKGFQEMKISLAANAHFNNKNSVNTKIEDADSVLTISDKVFELNIKTLSETLAALDENKIEFAVHKILNARNIIFFGSGGSSLIALDAYHKFITCGLNVKADIDSHFQIMSASQMSRKDLAIIISHSGSTNDILDIVKILNQNNVPIISITNFAKSHLTDNSDISLCTISDETYFRWEALSSRIAQLSIIDVLYTITSHRVKEQSLDSFKKIRDSIAYKRL